MPSKKVTDLVETLKNSSSYNVEEEKVIACRKLAAINLSQDYIQVEDKSKDDITQLITQVIADAKVKQQGELDVYHYVYTFPYGRCIYVKELQRFCFVKKGMAKRDDERNIQINTVLPYLLKAVQTGSRVLKRTIYYTYKSFFANSRVVDLVIRDICLMLNCTRDSLNIIASAKGLVQGKFYYTLGDHKADCSIGPERLITHQLQKSVLENNGSLFVLLVEKETIFSHIVLDGFIERIPCIIITGKGFPDVATRMFLRKLKLELDLPIFGLVDCNPCGLDILMTYRCGSQNMSYDNENLTTPGIRWIGLFPQEVDKLHIREVDQMDMRKKAKSLLTRLVDEPFIKEGEWKLEALAMQSVGKTVKLEALCSIAMGYLTQKYLPKKLELTVSR